MLVGEESPFLPCFNHHVSITMFLCFSSLVQQRRVSVFRPFWRRPKSKPEVAMVSILAVDPTQRLRQPPTSWTTSSMVEIPCDLVNHQWPWSQKLCKPRTCLLNTANGSLWRPWYIYIYLLYMCVCVHVYYRHTHTHTHTYTPYRMGPPR